MDTRTIQYTVKYCDERGGIVSRTYNANQRNAALADFHAMTDGKDVPADDSDMQARGWEDETTELRGETVTGYAEDRGNWAVSFNASIVHVPTAREYGLSESSRGHRTVTPRHGQALNALAELSGNTLRDVCAQFQAGWDAARNTTTTN